MLRLGLGLGFRLGLGLGFVLAAWRSACAPVLPKQLRARSSEVRVSFTVSISARPTSAASLTWLLARESSVRQPFDLSASASATVPG